MSNSLTHSQKSNSQSNTDSPPITPEAPSAHHEQLDTDTPNNGMGDDIFVLDPVEDHKAIAKATNAPRTVGRRNKARRGREIKHEEPLLVKDETDSDSSEEAVVILPTILRLPNELLSRILAHLDPVTLLRTSQVCKTFAAVVKDEATWRLAFALAFRVVDDVGLTPVFRRVEASSWKADYTKRIETLR